jgi:hypothetical protein
VVRSPSAESLGGGAVRRGNAERGRRCRRRARGAAGWRPGNDFHGQPGPAPDDPEHVQDRGRADASGLPCDGACGRHACTLDLRRPQRCHGRALDRLRAAFVIVGAGSAGPRGDCTRRDTRIAGAVPAFLRRVPHIARAPEDCGDRRRRTSHAPRSRIGRRSARASVNAGPPGRARHRAEPGRLLPESRGRQPLLSRDAWHRAARDGSVGRHHRPATPAVRVPRRPGRGTRHCHHGLGRGDGPRDHRCARPIHETRRRHGETVSPVQRSGFRRGAAAHGAEDRGAGSDQGARGDRRTAVSGRRDGVNRSPARAGPSRHRRPLRARLEGIHPGHGQGGVRPARGAIAEAPFHHRDRRRRHRTVVEGGRALRGRTNRLGARGVLRSRGRRHRPRTRTRSRSSAKRRTTGRRAISSTTRRNPAPRRFRTCVLGGRRFMPLT